ncbi:hypothetical protein TrVE_jg12394 [Triparma verrucosa]|uniref:RNA helicase n=1 Tax=Triparma verrucosa TaxID=1606542 RepID=A0A9W7FBG5_9STRA|nr:hypothetical protein TrVE_jg12394 [Triparma verrucosa]
MSSSRGGGRGGGGPRGGGRGGNRSNNNGNSRNNNNNSNSNSNNNSNGNFKPNNPPPPKANGELGAASFVISESSKIRFTTLLTQFRDSPTPDMKMPTDLTNTERKYIHELARGLGLKSKSEGKAPNRFIKVWKTTQTAVSRDVETIPSYSLPPKFSFTTPSVKLSQKTYSAPPAPSPPKPPQSSNPNLPPPFPDPTENLPAFSHLDQIIETVSSHKVTLITGSTGCGKSTQIPKYLYRAFPRCNMIVTQPRRISATSLSARVKEEMNDNLGVVGHSVRLSNNCGKSTRIKFVTPAILIQQLNNVAEYTHVIVDEVHERECYTDFLLIALRDLIENLNVKLILMSATLNVEVMREYFGGCGEVHMEGRTFPVQSFFLEDVLRATKYVSNDDNNIEKELEKKGFKEEKFRCEFCSRGFVGVEELGAHYGVCVGGGVGGIQMDFGKVEDRLRAGIDNPVKRPAKAEQDEYEDYEEYEEYEEYDEDGDEDDDGDAPPGVWDGVSEFTVVKDTTVTDDDLVSTYQARFNDDDVDYDLILALLGYIMTVSTSEDAILIFLPGWYDICKLGNELEGGGFSDPRKYKVLQLHSGVPANEQREVFKRPPKGCRKIILSTNIAETSVTIDDISFVIDSVKAKEKGYDPHLGTATLATQWISEASAMQRRGRAGRCKAGVCFHLVSKRRFKVLRGFLESELLRTPLESLCILTKRLNLAPGPYEGVDGIPAFLAKAIDQPHEKSIANAVERLIEIGACDDEKNQLTGLGWKLGGLSVDVRYGKAAIWGLILGVSHSTTLIAVTSSTKDPFNLPRPYQKNAAEAAKLSLAAGSQSDQICLLNAASKFSNSKRTGRGNVTGNSHRFCNDHFLSANALQTVVDTVHTMSRELTSVNLPSPLKAGHHTRNDGREDLIAACMCAGLYPNILRREAGESNYSTALNRKCKIHASSVNALGGSPLSRKSQTGEWLVYHECIKGPNSFQVRGVARIWDILPILIFCGTMGVRECEDEGMQIVTVDEWIAFKMAEPEIESLKKMRGKMDEVFIKFTENNGKLSEGDWKAVDEVCSCLKQGYEKKRKEGAAASVFVGNGGGGGDSKAGDWTCPKCRVNNFASRQKCFKCNAAKR